MFNWGMAMASKDKEISFVDAVQKRHVESPNSGKFSQEEWRRVYKETKKTPRCTEVFETGLVLFGFYVFYDRGIKQEGSLLTENPAKIMVGASNQDVMFMEIGWAQSMNTLSSKGFNIDDAKSIKGEADMSYVGNIDEATETGVEALSRALSFTKDVGFVDQKKRGRGIGIDLMTNLLRAHASRSIVDAIWKKCLWQGYKGRLDQNKDSEMGLPAFVFEPSNSFNGPSEKILAACNHRHYTLLALEMFDNSIIQTNKSGLKIVKSIDLSENNDWAFTVYDNVSVQNPRLAQFLNKRMQIVDDPVNQELMNISIGSLAGCTARQVCEAWIAVSHLSEAVKKKCVSDFLAKTTKKEKKKINGAVIEKFAPEFKKDFLIKFMSKSMGIDQKKAEILIDFLIFDYKNKENIWSQPIVKIGVDTFSLVWGACNVQPRYFIEKVAARLGLEVTKKGPAFEKYCAHRISHAANKNNFLDFEMSKGGAKFRPFGNGLYEEIDCSFFADGILFVCEIKCLNRPTETVLYNNHRGKVDEAAEQAKRKALFVEANIEKFCAIYHPLRAYSTVKSVQPLVLLNNAIWAGQPINGIPVVDLPILEELLSGRHMKSFERRGEVVTKKYRDIYPLPTRPGDVAEQMKKMLFSPPQLAHYLKIMTRIDKFLPLLPWVEFQGKRHPRVIFAQFIAVEMTANMLKRDTFFASETSPPSSVSHINKKKGMR